MQFHWLAMRLRAMSVPEIRYRCILKARSFVEKNKYQSRRSVYQLIDPLKMPNADFSVLGINYENKDIISLDTDIRLFGPFDYKDYKNNWFYSFKCDSEWPLNFSSDYNFGDKPIGDIRTNWQLSRHYQFLLLAKSYFVTKDDCYLDELIELFYDWNNSNPFMWGVEWSSPMEISIRMINWLYAAAFLNESKESTPKVQQLICDMVCGSYVMMRHITKHYSLYSSANNHLIVEAVGVAIAALVFCDENTYVECESTLTKELCNQTYPDGVNKEEALHYQLFVMEGCLLLMHCAKASGKSIRESWKLLIEKMSNFVSCCQYGDGSYFSYGDDDEGYILSLSASCDNYVERVLLFAELELGLNYRIVSPRKPNETIAWLFYNKEIKASRDNELKHLENFSLFNDGGIAIFRNLENNSTLFFDYGPLGFGSLAAHGHADALSVQLAVGERLFIVDPGTYIYNSDEDMRNLFRSTGMHSTVVVNDSSQSEILGPFLWGRKANASLRDFRNLPDKGGCIIVADHDGYEGCVIERKIHVNRGFVKIYDSLHASCDSVISSSVSLFHLHPSVSIEKHSDYCCALINEGHRICISFSSPYEVFDSFYSSSYGEVEPCQVLSVSFNGSLETDIQLSS